MSNLEEAKEEVSLILHKITQRDEDYFLDGKYCRWGRVERDLWAVLERHLTPLAPDAGESAASSGIVQASAESTSQAESAPTQRG